MKNKNATKIHENVERFIYIGYNEEKMGKRLRKRGVRMKRVAFFTDGWRKYFNYAWIAGCNNYIKEHNLDINLYVFNSFGNFSQDEKFNMGEYNIYNLPDLSAFDGILVDFTNVMVEDVRKKLMDRIREANIPVVSLIMPLEGACCAGIDNYAAMSKIVEHMITEHGCKVLNYVGGPEDSWENQARFTAYKDTLTKYGIPVEERRIYHRDYAIETGEFAFDHFKEQNLLPEAFICANDNIAVGLCHKAKQFDLQVPKDFLVTGFDNFDKASVYNPRITTAGFIREDIAYKAMESLYKLMEGMPTEKIVYGEVLHVFQDSCGCVAENPFDHARYVEDKIFSEDRDVRMTNRMLEVKRTLMECRSFSELGECLPKYLEVLRCNSIYMLMDKAYVNAEQYDNPDVVKEKYTFEGALSKEMQVVLAYRNGQVYSDVKLSRPGKLIPEEIAEGGHVYVFSPLHFREKEVGYFVFKNSDYMLDGQLIFEFLNVLWESLENMYHRILLNKMNEELSNLYVRDSLTGLYNRMAYNRFAIPMFEKCMEEGKPLMIMFVDSDRLKYINDTFGHDMGNVAIKTVSRAISVNLPEDGIAIRYGGDEFVVMVPNYAKEQAIELVEKMRGHVQRTSTALNTGFEITASIGFVIAEDKSIGLADYINAADEKMYENKRAKKVTRE